MHRRAPEGESDSEPVPEATPVGSMARGFGRDQRLQHQSVDSTGRVAANAKRIAVDTMKDVEVSAWVRELDRSGNAA